MCYDLSFSVNIELITDYIPDLIIDPQISVDYDTSIHVTAHAFLKKTIVLMQDGEKHLKEFGWGVIANYMNTPELVTKHRKWMCNAQAEKLLDKSSYWYRIRQQRCLIPVRGIYEHREIKGWKNKVPYHIKLKDRELFCLPGLYNYSPIPDMETDEVKGTFTVITRAANRIMSQIHNGGDRAFRMPLFLPKELELKWIEPDLSNEEIAGILDFEMPSEALDYHPVYTLRTTKERPDGMGKTDPFHWDSLPPLGQDSNSLSLFA